MRDFAAMPSCGRQLQRRSALEVKAARDDLECDGVIVMGPGELLLLVRKKATRPAVVEAVPITVVPIGARN